MQESKKIYVVEHHRSEEGKNYAIVDCFHTNYDNLKYKFNSPTLVSVLACNTHKQAMETAAAWNESWENEA